MKGCKMFKDLRSYNSKKFLNDAGQGGIIAMTVLPLALAFGADSPIGITASLFAAIAAASLLSLFGGSGAVYAPSCVIFIVFSEMLSKNGWGAALLSCVLAGIILFILSLLKKAELAAQIPSYIYQGFLLGVTVDMAILQVTNYFDIGATGATAVEMLKSYKYVGFHSNWRTVLFATILLVVMITYPIKFKKLSKIVPAAFSGIVITIALNLFLNPDVEDTNVIEFGKISLNLLNDRALIFGGLKIASVQSILVGAFVLAFLINAESFINCNSDEKANSLSLGIFNIISPVFGGMPLTAAAKTKGTRLAGVFAGFFMFSFIALFRNLIARLPISTLATILIISTWNLISWKEVKKIFADKKVLHDLIYFAAVVFTVLVDLTLAVAVIMVISIILTLSERRRTSAK